VVRPQRNQAEWIRRKFIKIKSAGIRLENIKRFIYLKLDKILFSFS
jgi:hypothetical protein